MKKILMASVLAVTASQTAQADSYYQPTYSVSITNITKGISFTPFIAASHNKHVKFFELGAAPSDALAALAEGGDVAPLQTVLDDYHGVYDSTTTAGLLGPGETVNFELSASWRYSRLSFAAMLLPTNDSFVALSGVAFPKFKSKTYTASAYDAGSEINDEYCASIPGPTCGGVGISPESLGEGYGARTCLAVRRARVRESISIAKQSA